MLSQIPTHLIGGPLGAGKTSLLRQLMAQRPEYERWAILVNEFGEIGLDAALLDRGEDGVAIAEVAGGCLCWVNGVPFQVGLGRLLRKARPDRLFIEPSGLGHPLQLRAQLQQAPWDGVLALQPLVMVLDAAALAAGQPLPEAQDQALEEAGLWLLNKSEQLDAAARQRVLDALPDTGVAQRWTHDGLLAFDELPRAALGEWRDSLPAAEAAQALPLLRREYPLRREGEGEGLFSIGWRVHRDWQFRPAAVEAWLASLPDVLRAKLVLHGEEGWSACNRVRGDEPWAASAWRRDNRIELILAARPDADALQRGLFQCARLED
ncbi:MAG: Zinc-binding GTPase YeiR [Stenotrophomonas maltophilia]|nr:MAG: Zinc-binding GTPase YeiR [Stenotrophomonas maltophilia]